MKAETTFSLKDQLFRKEKVVAFASRFREAWPEFPKKKYISKVMKAFPELELKARIVHMTTVLHELLPQDYAAALDIVVKSLPEKLDPKKTDDDFGDFINAPMGHFIALYGCDTKNLNRSLKALKECTMRFSVEDAIRYFINAFPEKTMAFLAKCATDKNYHVRRLASEGTRASLPWCQKIGINYKEPMPILNLLHSDPTRYVTRSVANHLNDISKIDPDLVIDSIKNWKKEKKQIDKEIDFIASHGMRTLVKQGNKKALTVLGFGTKPNVEIKARKTLTPTVKVGDAFIFEFELNSKKDQRLMIDYTMHFAGGKGSKKVFKLKQLELKKGANIMIEKKHPMRLMTTRRLYEGVHKIVIQSNGYDYNELSFLLKE